VEDQFETFSETVSIAVEKKSLILLNISHSRLSSRRCYANIWNATQTSYSHTGLYGREFDISGEGRNRRIVI
jgi:hypothetical protein